MSLYERNVCLLVEVIHSVYFNVIELLEIVFVQVILHVF